MTVWRDLDGWRYEYFDRDVDPATLTGFESLAQVWHSKRDGRAVPAWTPPSPPPARSEH